MLRRFALAVWILALDPAVAGAAKPGAEYSRFHRTALALRDAAPESRRTFATVALGELAAVYIAEADLARVEAGPQATDKKLLRWSEAVDRFASQLLLMLEDVEQGYPVGVDPRREDSVAVSAGGRLVMLSHPRLGQQEQFEQRVLADFCSRTDCTVLTARETPDEPIPLYAGVVRPGWSFTERGPVCSHDGIRVQFSAASDLARLRDACRQFFMEVSTLVTEIAWQQLHGASIDWHALAISSTPGQPEHFVRLNAAGDSVLVTLPMLNASPGLLAELVPWLRVRSSGGEASLLLQGDRWGGGESGAGDDQIPGVRPRLSG